MSAVEHALSGLGHYIRREPREALRAAENTAKLCELVEMPAFVPVASVLRAWALVQLRDEAAEAELERARQAMGEMLPLWQPMLYPAVLACEVAGGHVESGFSGSVQAMSQIRNSGVRFAEAELLRLRGELALALPDGAPSEAESWFEKALEVARDQQAKWWELRAATSLARLWQSQGNAAEAHALLFPVYDWFTEGFETADLKDAKALLDELK